MKYSKIATLVAAGLVLAGCNSTPSQQTYAVESNAGNSSLIIGKSAFEFTNSDIEVPAYFNTQGLQFCTYEANEKDSRCPLAKKTIRLYFGDVQTDVSENLQGKSADVFNAMHSSIGKFETKALENTLENQFAGVNRFRILTRDTKSVNAAMEEILADEGAAKVAQKMSGRDKLSTDYIMKVDVLKTGDMLFGSTQSLFQTSMEMTTGVIDPYTREKLSYPNIGKIRVSNFDVRDKESFTTVIANGDYYRGFNYTSSKDVDSVMNEMASRGFDIMLTRLLKEMPATAQVMGIKGDRISLDRGQNAGVLPNETMVVFEYSAGFVEPIGVATVNPSQQSAQGKIVRWKDSKLAEQVKDEAEQGIYRPDRQRRIFAVSVGVPMEFMKERSTWAQKGISLSLTLGGLLSAAPAAALELDKSQSTLALVEQGCAYGRGALAIEGAKADAINNLRLFLNGQVSLSLSSEDSELLNEQFNQAAREMLVTGIERGMITADFGQPEIYGDDTCVNVRLMPPTQTEEDSDEGIVWGSDSTVSVVVIGEGIPNAKQGLSARQAAEQDAFRRAISQVLGVMVKSGYLQQTYSSMSANAVSDDFNLHDVAVQSLSMQSQGMITGWSEISSQTKPNGVLVVTLDVSVERQKVEAKIAQLIKSLGQPAVYVDAHLPVVQTTFSSSLAQMGFDLSGTPEQATIILQVQEKEKVTPSGLQLELAAKLLDRAGNEYGNWHNDPTLMTLPNKEGMLNELASVHLAVDQNQKMLTQALHSAVQKMAMRGGPVRELIFTPKAAGQQGQLYTLLSAINGVSDIKIESRSGKVIVRLRSLNNANDLAQFIQPTLRIHQPNYQSKLRVLNDYQINVL